MKKVSETLIAACALFVFCLIPFRANAQSGINSPYSRYGVGILSDQSTGDAKSMGGLGAGYRQTNSINIKNPASYSTVDTLTFIADLGFALQNGNYSENGVKVNAHNAYMDHMTIQFRILPKVGMTVGLSPFSNTGYSFSSTELIRRDEDGEVLAYNTYSGTGGVRQFLAGLGWRPTKWLSGGMNVSYLTGDINHYIYNTYSSSVIQSRVKTYETSMAAVKLDFGLQGTMQVAGGNLVLGATLTPAQKLECETYVSDVHSSGDTISVADAFSLPDMVSAGFTFSRDKYMFGADVSYQTWSKASFFGEKYGCDRLTAAVGFMYRPDEMSRNILKRTAYLVGANFSQPYYMMGGSKGPWQLGVSAGLTVPVSTSYTSLSQLHISGEYVRVQPGSPGMITENYLRINIGVTFLERWFMKLMVD